MPFAVGVFLDERTAVAPNPGGKVVRKVPVAPAWECVAPYMGAVFKNFVFVVDLANGVFESFVGSNGIFSDAVFSKDSLVGKNSSNIDKPRHGIDCRVFVDMGRVPADGDKTFRLNCRKFFV